VSVRLPSITPSTLCSCATTTHRGPGCPRALISAMLLVLFCCLFVGYKGDAEVASVTTFYFFNEKMLFVSLLNSDPSHAEGHF